MLPALRQPYQLEAVSSIVRELMYRDSTLRVAATGTGKTAEIGALARIHLRRGGKRVLVTAPRGELLDQAEAWVSRWCPFLHPSEIGREQGDSHCHAGHKVVLASLQSLSAERMESMPLFDLIIEDEGHLFYDQRRNTHGQWPKAKRVGFTATPDRSDLRALIPARYESCPPAQVYEIGKAIEDGWLVQPVFKQVKLDCLDVAGLPRSGEDFEQESLSKMMRKNEAIMVTAGAITQLNADRPTLVFCVDIAHAEALHSMTNSLVGWNAARLAHGNLSRRERADNLAGFIAGDFPILVTVVLLTYGWDAPPTSCVVMARPTCSRALYCQSIGRGLRLHPGKEDCLVLDLVGNTDEHRLVTPKEALAPQYEEIEPRPEVVANMRSFLDTQEASDAAVLAALEDNDPTPTIPISTAFTVTEVQGQLEPLGIDTGVRFKTDVPATYRQVKMLKEMGVDNADLLSIRQASDLIGELVERQKAGWCTLRQALFLWRKGLNPRVKREVAGEAIEAIKGNGGRVPLRLRRDARLVHRQGAAVVLR